MRNEAVKKAILPILGLSLVLGSSLVLATKPSKAEQVEGYSTSSLPTTIDLNDTTPANIRSYYSSLNGLSTSERQGNNLLKNLKTILKNGQKYYSYDSGSAIWQIYEIADRDWVKSPANSTTYGTYNDSTKKITNYQYGTSSSSSKNNPYIHALYVNRGVNNQTTAWDDHQQTQWGINREHVWPKAEGFEGSGQGGARGDPMHLMAGNGHANNIHSNYFYGYVNTSASGGYTNCGSKYSNLSGNLLGKSKTLGGNTNVFEPQDCDKGDIARAIFYMVARYNYLSKSDSDGIDSNNPNLALTQSLSDWASSGYSSTTSTKGYMGIMTDLLAWHHADPVDSYEIHRNNLLYINYTNNRNPFIDFPEWADFIWGSVNYSGSTYISHSTTPTGYATPSSDTINGYNSGGGSSETTAVTGISLNTNSTSIEVGEDVTLTATIAPSDATNQGVSWSTSNSSVATVSSGVVTGVAEGSATVTATSSDGGFTVTCTVTVTASQGGGGQSEDTTTATINIGAYASSNSWGNGTKHTSINVDSICSASASDGTYTGNYYTTGSEWRFYQSESATLTISLQSGYELDSVTLSFSTSNSGQLTGPSGTVVTSGSAYSVSGSSATFSVGKSGSGTNGQIKFTEISVTYHQTTSEKTLSSIAVKTAPTKLTYTAGDGFSPVGLVITATYSDASTADISYEGNEDVFEFDPFDNLQTSDQSITISFGGKTCTQAIAVNASKILSSISINTDNVTKSFYVDDEFEHDNLVVTAHFSDSSIEVVSSSATISTPDMSTAGDKTVTVSYTYGGTTKTESYTITVNQGGGESYDETTIAKTMSEIISENSFTVSSGSDATCYTSFNLDSIVTISTTGSANCGAFYGTSPNNEWRLYQNKSGNIIVTAVSGYELDSVTFTFSVTNTGDLKDSDSNSVLSASPITITGSTVTFTVCNSGSATNGQVRLSAISVTYHSTSSGGTDPVTSITASVSKSFYVGETISKSDITLKDNNNNTISGSNYSFADDGYQFTYTDATSGGGATSKTFTNSITYLELTCSLTVSVSREEYATPETESITLTSSEVFSGIGGGNKNLQDGTVTNGGITYQYYQAYYYSGGSALSFGNASSQTGYLKNQTAFDAGITNVTVESFGRTVNIRYSTDGSTWVLKSGADVENNIYKYFKVDCVGVSGSNYSNITSISITANGEETAINIANYIMYEDTQNQCTFKFTVAKTRFEQMSTSERATFMTSDDYVISTARTRLQAWANYLGKTITYSNNDYVISNNNYLSLMLRTNENSAISIIVVVSILGIGTIACYFFIKRRKPE